jgi:hypothetical protein
MILTSTDPYSPETAGSPVSLITSVEGKEDAAREEEGSPENLADDDCNSTVLESMDSCVAFVEGAELQHHFEESMGNMELIESPIITGSCGELSPREAAMIRLQISQNQTGELPTLSTLNDLDLLNICGSDDVADGARAMPTAANEPGTDTWLGRFGSSQGDAVATPLGVDETLTEEPLQCAICFDEALASSNTITFARFPCCGHADESSTIKICTSCVLVLTNPTSDGESRVGRCPRCRSWIVVRVLSLAQHNEMQISAVSAAGTCRICNQVKDHLVDQEACDSCFLGLRYPLLYECDSCHTTQRIPHPMYRYQKSPEDFGNVTWACQGRCGSFSHWRIRADQVESIPMGDAPREWGENYLAAARARVVSARNQLAGEDPNSCSML